MIPSRNSWSNRALGMAFLCIGALVAYKSAETIYAFVQTGQIYWGRPPRRYEGVTALAGHMLMLLGGGWAAATGLAKITGFEDQ